MQIERHSLEIIVILLKWIANASPLIAVAAYKYNTLIKVNKPFQLVRYN